jgi:hypothetical protein
MDDENVEEWERLTDVPESRGVEAILAEGKDWRIVVWVAEFVREEPTFESELAAGVEAALRSVSGVTGVWREDREQWVAEGEPSGRELVGAVAAFLDAFAERTSSEVHTRTPAEALSVSVMEELPGEWLAIYRNGERITFRYWIRPQQGDEASIVEEVKWHTLKHLEISTSVVHTAVWTSDGTEWHAEVRPTGATS